MRKIFLETIVFLCGAVVMIYEIAGSRVLGPYLGTSIFIWTSLIGIILGSLSLGYWLGGRLADRKPTYTMLARIVLAAAVLVGLTTWLKDIFLHLLPRVISGLKWQTVVASFFLFAPASIFLGMVSPYAVRLKIKTLKTSGRTVGNLYAISTVGSIVGTFAAGFYLIPAMGTTQILVSLTILLALISIALFTFNREKLKSLPALFVILIAGYFLLVKQDESVFFIDKNTQYSRVWIYDATDAATAKPIRFMRINNESSSAMFLDSEEPVFDYMKYYRLAEHFTPGFQSTLILGGAAYSYPKYFLERYDHATIDVVEIDPQLTELAQQYFRLKDDPRMNIFHEDGRIFLNRGDYNYDVIFGDTFQSLYTLPWHLTTREAVQKKYNMLNEGGSALINIISSLDGKASYFLRAELATYRDVFPWVYVFAVTDPEDKHLVQSTLLVAMKSDHPPVLYSDDSELAEYLQHDITDQLVADLPILTDEFAPVDYYTNKAIR
ncbi:MAG: fused MFS/spermidine synthase [Bacteroidales bacterium]